MNSEDEEQNATKILSQQRLSQLAKDKAHINLLKEIDKKRPQYIIKGEKETFSQGNSILAAAQRAKENALDASKEMSTLLRCSKVASIRDLQREEHKKLTKKEQIKMQKKQEKKEQRDAMLLAMEEKKRREQEKQMQLLLKEKEKEEEAKRIEEEAKRIAEEKKKKEDEEYDKWRDLIKVGEEGEDRMDFEKEETINKFLDYIKIRKVVSLEDISGTFKLNPNEIVEKLNKYENEGRIMGIIDDRGKYIYITEKEMGLIEKMLTNRGRISKTDLIKECNRLIRFEPTEQDKIKIAEEQEKTLKELEEELKVKK